MQFNTDFEETNRSIPLDTITKMGVINLKSNTQFNGNPSINSSFNIRLFANSNLTATINITFNEEVETQIITIDADLKGSQIWAKFYFIGLILISMIIGLMFATGENNSGLHTFMAGCLISPIFGSGFGWLAFTSAIYYTGRLVAKWISQ